MQISKEGCTIYPIIVPTKISLKTFNFYLLEQAGSLSLIDAGLNSTKCWEYFNRTMAENGFTLQDISRIILTHNHHDHVGLINRITSTTAKEIPVYAHVESIHRLKRDKEFFSLRVEFFRKLYDEMGCGEVGKQQVAKLEEAVQDNEKDKIQADIVPLTESDLIAGLQAIETPGHSPRSFGFLRCTEKMALWRGSPN